MLGADGRKPARHKHGVRQWKRIDMSSGANEIIGLYERHAEAWDRNRIPDLILEREWMELFVALLPSGGLVLDLGCGSGQPIARISSSADSLLSEWILR